MTREITEFDIAFSAACLWEHFLENIDDYSYFRRRAGMAQFRDNVCQMARPVEEAYIRVVDIYGYDDCFDWEFVPLFINTCVNSNTIELLPDYLNLLDGALPHD